VDGDAVSEPQRNEDFERGFLTRVVEMAQRLTGIPAFSYPARVLRRMADGHLEHGNTWHQKDCGAEAIQEPPDTTAWLMFEIQRQRALGLNDENTIAQAELNFLAASAYASVSDYYAQLGVRQLRGED
jgi:hypothetical protein